MKYLMIHKFIEEYLEYNLNDYILTFDDGLYNNYKWYPIIREKFPETQMIFFISTNIIHSGNSPQNPNIDAPDAHDLFFNFNDTSPYMTLDQIKELNKEDNVTIGYHGHNHLNLNDLKQYKLKKQLDIFRDDYLTMFNTFDKYDILTDIYCTPYNQYNDLLMMILKKDYKNIYNKDLTIIGLNRTDIESFRATN